MLNTYLNKSKYLHRVLCLIDAEHQFKEVDYLLLDMLEAKKQPFMVVFTKCDKVHKVENLFKHA